MNKQLLSVFSASVFVLGASAQAATVDLEITGSWTTSDFDVSYNWSGGNSRGR